MTLSQKRKTAAILRLLHQSGQPMGSAAISDQLSSVGIDLRERMVRYYLEITDKKGLTQNLGRRGRILTEQGIKELDVAVAIDKVGFVNARIDDLTYRMNFDETALTGSVIVNVSIVRTYHRRQTLETVTRVMQAGLGMGQYLWTAYAGQKILETGRIVPNDALAVGTLCSVTINGIFLRNKIAMKSRFGGLLEYYQGIPARFSQIISYDGSSLDPIEIFIKGRMTSVNQVLQTGNGTIGASFREIPIAAIDRAHNLIRQLNKINLGGVLMIGKPNQPLLDIPVSVGHIGLIVAGGLNPLAALEEDGISTENQALHTLADFSHLRIIDSQTNETPQHENQQP